VSEDERERDRVGEREIKASEREGE